MIVLDASAAVDWLFQTSAGRSIEKRIYSRNETLHAPPPGNSTEGRSIRKTITNSGDS
jgi:hypothetical protein